MIDSCILEGNAEAGVEAFGKETRLQLDKTQINGNEECGIRGNRAPMIYLVGNQVGDPDAMDSTCLVMKDGIRHVITKELPGAQLVQDKFEDYVTNVPERKIKGYFKITPSQQILAAKAKRKKDAEDAAEAKRVEAVSYTHLTLPTICSV